MTRPSSVTVRRAFTRLSVWKRAIRACRSTRKIASTARRATSRTRRRISIGSCPKVAAAPIIPTCKGLRSMLYPRSLLLGLSACALAVPACALAPSQGSLYLRTRAAEALGDVPSANAGFAALMTQDPGNTVIADHAYRQAILGGDLTL